MRILLISRCPPWPLYLGDRLIVYHLAEELEARKHTIDLLAFTNRVEDLAERDEYDHLFEHVELLPEPPRSQTSYLRRLLLPGTRFPNRADDSWSPEMWRLIESRLASQHYDAIHLFGGIHVYEFFHALGGQRAVITPYESYSLYLRREIETTKPSPFSSVHLRHQIARRFESFMFAPYADTVVVSDRDRDELRSINPALRLTVIPNGVDTYQFRPRPVARIPALLFVGNYEYAPNVDAALRLATEIFPAVKAAIPQTRLWLVGNAPPPELTRLANDHIRVTGRVPDVRPYLARASAFVSPLRLGAGIKNKVLEALAMGCPVVGTSVSLDGIAVTHGQDALQADGQPMVDAIIRLLQDKTLRDQLSRNGRELIEKHYSWDSVGERYEALYQQLAAQH
ncbi:MAG: glycosyltransferase family 4 protein [Chloroflexi bacterium]|nr:glycosyltransferase family 4 protein [Chloroflexota bacterium]MCC6895170.1 glycosyltransferase [Anaerolineae bacterium]